MYISRLLASFLVFFSGLSAFAFQSTYDTSLLFHSDIDDSGVYTSSEHTEGTTEEFSAPSLRGSEDTSDNSLEQTADNSDITSNGSGDSAIASEDSESSETLNYSWAASSDSADGTTNNSGADGATTESITYGSVDGSSVESVDYSADTETSATLTEGGPTKGASETSMDGKESTQGSYVSETASYDSGSDASNGSTEFLVDGSQESRTSEATNVGSEATSGPSQNTTQDASDRDTSATLSHDLGTEYSSQNSVDPSDTHPSAVTDGAIDRSAMTSDEGTHTGAASSGGGGGDSATSAVASDGSEMTTYDSRTPNTTADTNEFSQVSSEETGQGSGNSVQGRTGAASTEGSGHSGAGTAQISSSEGLDTEPSRTSADTSQGGTDTHTEQLSQPTQDISASTAQTEPSAPSARSAAATQEPDTNTLTAPTAAGSEASRETQSGDVLEPTGTTTEGIQASDTDQLASPTADASEGTRIVSATEATDNTFAATTRVSDPLARNAQANNAYKRRALIEAAAYEAIVQLPTLLRAGGDPDYIPSDVVHAAIRLIDPDGKRSLVEAMVAILDEYRELQKS